MPTKEAEPSLRQSLGVSTAFMHHIYQEIIKLKTTPKDVKAFIIKTYDNWVGRHPEESSLHFESNLMHWADTKIKITTKAQGRRSIFHEDKASTDKVLKEQLENLITMQNDNQVELEHYKEQLKILDVKEDRLNLIYSGKYPKLLAEYGCPEGEQAAGEKIANALIEIKKNPQYGEHTALEVALQFRNWMRAKHQQYNLSYHDKDENFLNKTEKAYAQEFQTLPAKKLEYQKEIAQKEQLVAQLDKSIGNVFALLLRDHKGAAPKASSLQVE